MHASIASKGVDSSLACVRVSSAQCHVTVRNVWANGKSDSKPKADLFIYIYISAIPEVSKIFWKTGREYLSMKKLLSTLRTAGCYFVTSTFPRHLRQRRALSTPRSSTPTCQSSPPGTPTRNKEWAPDGPDGEKQLVVTAQHLSTSLNHSNPRETPRCCISGSRKKFSCFGTHSTS